MNALTVSRHFAGVDIAGLLALDGVLDELIEALRDGDRMEALTRAVEATAVIEADSDARETDLAKVRLEEAREVLVRELRGRKVRLGLDTGRVLRQELHNARLGEGRADDWQARRRVA